MDDNISVYDFGVVISKPPLETGLVATILTMAQQVMNQRGSVSVFLISDGVWLAKKNQRNHVAELFKTLLQNGVNVTVSAEHLTAAGISENELYDGLHITKKTYSDLVDNVMEQWKKVVTI
jgi:sulfur relay protein TusB/DsrH